MADNIKSISADTLPSEMFLYPLCTTRTGFEAMLEAMDNYYQQQHERVEIIKDFLNAQEFVDNPLEQPCLKELIEDLLANQPPTIKYIQSEIDSEIDCQCEEDFMPCNCGNVRFCDGKLQYKDEATGQWQDLPGTALTPPDDIPDIDLTGNGGDVRCFKANGAWDALTVVVNAWLQLLANSATDLSQQTAYWNEQFPGIQVNQTGLMALLNSAPDWTGATLDSMVEYWQLNQTAIKDGFTCKAQDFLSLSTGFQAEPELVLLHALDFTWVSDASFREMLTFANQVPGVSMLKQYSAARITASSGDCNCGGGGGAPITENCRVLRFVKMTLDFTHLSHPTGIPNLSTVLNAQAWGTKSGSIYTAQPYENPDPEEYRNYRLGVLFQFDPDLVTVNRIRSRHTASPATGNWLAATWWGHDGIDTSDAWAEIARTPDDPTTAPLPANYNFDTGELASGFKYLLIGVTALTDEGTNLTVQLKDIQLEITIGTERFTAVLPDIQVCGDE